MTRLKRIPKTGIPETPEGAVPIYAYRSEDSEWYIEQICDYAATHYCFILPPDDEADLRQEFQDKLAMHSTLASSSFELSPDNLYLDSVVENLYQAFKLGRS